MKSSLNNDGWKEFIQQCLKFKNTTELEVFFNVFLTCSEKEELAKRFLIVKELLANKKTQREIAHTLQVSIANVSRGSNTIKNSDHDLKALLHF